MHIQSAFDLKTRQNFKLKIQANDSLEVDGGLKTDGYFTYNDKSIIFTQYKKGNFYRINNDLDKIIHYNTIDNLENVEGVKKSKSDTYYFEKPVLNSNLLTSVFNNKIYIISFVKGNSDQHTDFTKYRTVDVYNFNDGKYIESFHLPNHGINKAEDFHINNNKIYLLFGNKAVIYELN